MHLAILDVCGTTVIVQVYGPTSDVGFASTMAGVQPIIDSMRFTPRS